MKKTAPYTQLNNDAPLESIKDDHQLSDDAPLENTDDDRLNRSKFSIQLSQSIIKANLTNGFVYALYGPWGSGKSTLINFVEHFIEEHNKKTDKKETVVIFRFNPWMCSDAQSLVLLFLKQLQATLNMSDIDKLKRIAKKIAVLQKCLGLTTFATAALLDLYAPGSGSTVIVIMQKISKFLSQSKATIESIDEAQSKNLNSVKEEIIEALKDQDHRILVIIDDLDRCTSDEVREIVKVIKAICDFPKMIYLIACDSEKVAQALTPDISKGIEEGYNYLEKIVQCSWNIPQPTQRELIKLFKEKIDKLFPPLANKNGYLFNKEDVGQMIEEGIGPNLKTPRDIIRLLNYIRAVHPLVKDEVYLADFIGIQALRTFYPKAFSVVEASPHFFIGIENEKDKDQNKRVAFYNQDLHPTVSIDPSRLEKFQKLLGLLFPTYECHLNEFIIMIQHSIQKRRVCDKNY